ncbi:ribosomal protein S18 acetylase RimI-like enzyme [Paenibacillus shirakamiensis]|uniref:Ribosomal protein S18 acetylase RimI-like enzyme n=1 Tax=Paenibacillus shirakamiensis TaxID=1265935 RepID=A0ABS4JNN5_9BACL|nr:GNAT family N-acetyltransferase [Paenibacillus shirakamiensis]MBP2002756.1 ribosomal protein S18 acetylase RimI-like enzyme [Paenibacillus shirakamiensis]
MHSSITFAELSKLTPEVTVQLSSLLIEVVDQDASLGFLPPLGIDEARTYWEGVLTPEVRLWVAIKDDHILGTIQLHLVMKPNGRHRAEIAKLMVHPSGRREGIARTLMLLAEENARACNRTLLVLDTRAGDPSNFLYQSLNYIAAGSIPNYARSEKGQLDATVIYYKIIT